MSEAPVMRSWLVEPLPHDVAAAVDRLCRCEDVRQVAIMPDVHLAEGVCIGMVVATTRLIYPEAVGADIGCGMAAVRFDGDAERLADERVAARLLAGFGRVVPPIRHSSVTAPVALPAALSDAPLSHPRLEALKRRDARVEFATLGRGNHFLELQRAEDGGLWLMVHAGSRAAGHAILDHHRAQGGPTSGGLLAIDADSAGGVAYLADVAWALTYADLSRRAIIDAAAAIVCDVLDCGVQMESLITCHHNHVRREVHGGELLLVHRKGAMPAGAGVPGVVPGSMGTPSFHVEGRGCDAALRSSAHGAGRALSRSEARRTVTLRAFEQQVDGVWFDHRLAMALREEAPGAYKDITAVMRAQRDLVRIVRRLDPLLSYKAT